jgi:all-trans-retinol 13,14-reductase
VPFPPITNIGDGVYDDLVIGAGMAGLTIGALLAAEGRRVLMVEAHDTPGGYAHTFRMGSYGFCAQVHYIFNCGEGEPVHDLLTRLGLAKQVTFERLDPEGFDHVIVAGERHRIPNGHDKHRDRLIRRYPEAAEPIRGYFDTLKGIERELDALPAKLGLRDLLTAPLRFPRLLRYRKATLQQLYDELHMPQRLQAILAGQCGDYLLPPAEVSLLLHVALVRSYDRGAYYPHKHFRHYIDSIAEFIAAQPGCRVVMNTEVAEIIVERGRVSGVRTTGCEVLKAERYISNMDPKRTAQLLSTRALPRGYRRSLDYDYSCGTVTLYLGVRGLDLREHGFGNFNVWHYPHDDLNACYRAQNVDQNFDDPWLFMSTPTLHGGEPGLCPEGDQILEIATSAAYAPFKRMRDQDRRGYNAYKKKLRDNILRIVESQYVPGLAKHLVMQVTGTPATNARFCRAPEGNAYGAALTPKNVGATRMPFTTPFPNLWNVNATAGYPSIAGAVRAGLDLFEDLRR